MKKTYWIVGGVLLVLWYLNSRKASPYYTTPTFTTTDKTLPDNGYLLNPNRQPVYKKQPALAEYGLLTP